MFPLGFAAVAFGLFVVDCVVRKRPVIQSLKNILTDPANFRADNTALNGTTYAQSGAATASQGQAVAASTNPVVAYAMEQVGKRYAWAQPPANTPADATVNSFDCSGLSMMAYKQVGISLPHFSTAQSEKGTYVDPKNPSAWQPGDLLFPYPGHVAIYAGNGYCVEATNPSQGVVYDRAHASYWRVRRYTYSGESVSDMQHGLTGQAAHS